MKNRLYPTWQQLEEQNNSLIVGEKALIKFFDSDLPKDPSWEPELKKLKDYKVWLIFVQPFLKGTLSCIIILTHKLDLFFMKLQGDNQINK